MANRREHNKHVEDVAMVTWDLPFLLNLTVSTSRFIAKLKKSITINPRLSLIIAIAAMSFMLLPVAFSSH